MVVEKRAMTLTITLKPELQAWLHEESVARQTSEEDVVVRELESRWATAQNQAGRLSAAESSLLQRINEGFSEEFWLRFRELREQLEAETLTEADREEFLRSNDAVEAKNVERMEALLQLARLRGTSLPEVMRQLGIGPIQSV